MRTQNLLFIVSFLFMAHTSYGALSGTKFDGDPSDPEGVPASILPVGAPVPLAPVHASDAVSVLSDHDSDDEAFKELITEARDLGFAGDTTVKSRLRGLRHQRKLDEKSRAQAALDARRAAFLAKIGEPTAPKDELVKAVQGGSVARFKDDEYPECAGSATSAPSKEVSIEQLMWGFIKSTASHDSPSSTNLLHIPLAIKLFPPKDQPIFVEKLKKLLGSNNVLGHDSSATMYSSMNTFFSIFSTIPVDDRMAFIDHLVTLHVEGGGITNKIVATLAGASPAKWSSLIDAVKYFHSRSRPIAYPYPHLIEILAGIPADRQKRAIEQMLMITEPIPPLYEEQLGKILRLVSKTRDMDAFEDQIFKALKPEHLSSIGKSPFEKVYEVVQAVAARA